MSAFDQADYPGVEPSVLIAGDRWTWRRDDLGAIYSPSLYSLKYSARLEGSTATEIEITASEVGESYIVEVASLTTEAYTAGRYRWQLYVVRTADSERITVGSGSFEVKANRDTATTDPRSHVKKVLDAIEAVIESRATKDQESYTINGRSLSRTPIEKLLVLRDTYKIEYQRELAAEKIARGLGNPRRVGVRFNRV